jgi:alpha-tubulin suppressor-like RCC1 family protein
VRDSQLTACLFAALLYIPTLQAGNEVVAWAGNGPYQRDVPYTTQGAVAIAAGWVHNLALKPDGTVVTWGEDHGQLVIPADLTGAIAIAAGDNYSAALKANDQVIIWGQNIYGEQNVPVDLTNVVSIAGGGTHILALKADGTVAAWGDNSYGQTDVPDGLTNVTTITAGWYHSLVLKHDGTVVAWGRNWTGESYVPAGLTDVVDVGAGGGTSYAIKRDGTIVTWGTNYTWGGSMPRDLTNIVGVTGNERANMALRADGTVTGWGDDFLLILDPPLGLTNVVAIDMGVDHVVSLVADRAPFVTRPIPRQSSAVGATVVLQVSAAGADPLFYQWSFNGTALAGATNATLTIKNAQPNQAGTYSVRISNNFGSISSANVLNLLPIWITLQPQTHTTPLRHSTSFKVAAIGQEPMIYQWRFNDAPIRGATNKDLLLTNVLTADQGRYSVSLSNENGTVISAAASLWVNQVVGWGAYENWSSSRGFWTVPMVPPPGLTNIVEIASGENHALALRRDGTVFAWGNNAWGQTTLPVGLTNVIAIAAGANNNIALKSDGTLSAWGEFASMPVGPTNVVSVSAGRWHTAALRKDGTVSVWGVNNSGQMNVPSDLTNAVAIASGYDHILALRADGTVVAWGNNNEYQSTVPPGTSNIVAIACGDFHSVALKADGTLIAWGAGPTDVSRGLTNVIAIASGSSHMLAIKSDGSVMAWGWNATGQTNVPFDLNGPTAIAGGRYDSLALLGDGPPSITVPLVDRLGVLGTTTRFRCAATGAEPLYYQWQFNGTNLAGATNAILTLDNLRADQAGVYSLIVSNASGVAVGPPVLLDLTAIRIRVQPRDVITFVGNLASFNIDVEAAAPLKYQWQFNGNDLPGATNSSLVLTNVQLNQAGQYSVLLSNAFGSTTSVISRLSVSQVAPWGDPITGWTNLPKTLTNIIAIAAGGLHALALRPDGRVEAWGSGTYGQTNIPFDLTNAISVAAGYYHCLALTADGIVRAWGAGTNAFSSSPHHGQSRVPAGLSNVVAIAGGDYHSLALRADGTVVAWGLNGNGQTNLPQNLTNVVAIAAGGYHNLALRADGRVLAWGYNGSSQTNVPTSVSNVTAIAAGGFHSLALKDDGTVVGWGATTYNQTRAPTGLKNVQSIAAGYYHSLAQKADGTVIAWGSNTTGQTNVPAGLRNVVAISGAGYRSLALIGASPLPVRVRLSSAELGTQGFMVFLPSQSGRVYGLEYKKLLNDTNWKLLPLVPGTGDFLRMTDPTVATPSRYFRVRRW